jgi:hypothetical protein
MAYLIFAIGLVYSVAWGVGLGLASKSDGPKNTIIPGLGLVAFVWLTGMSAMAAKDAMDNPENINPSVYLSLTYNMSLEEVTGLLGAPVVNPDRASYDLTGKGLMIPGNISARLPAGENDAEAISSLLVLSIIGEPGRRNQRNTLGAKADSEGNGLSGLLIVLSENSNEVTFTEGEDWTYENGDTAEVVAKKIGEAIDAHPSWLAEGSPESAPTRVLIEPELEANIGEFGNTMEGWVATGANTSVKVGIADNGEPQRFRGGMDSVTLKFWYEDEAVLDGNFSMTDRLVLVGFIGDKLSAVRQSGIALLPEQMSLVQDAIVEARTAEEEAEEAAKQALKDAEAEEEEEKEE